MDTETKYQGWTNWDTWNANLWLTNDEYSYRCARSCATPVHLQLLWIDNFEGKDGIETSEVNFEEIYEGLQE